MEIEEQEFKNEGGSCRTNLDEGWLNQIQLEEGEQPVGKKYEQRNDYQLAYPYNCIVKTESIGYIPCYPCNKHINYGTGALVHCNLVLTCAHNLYFFSNRFQQRVEAK